MKKIKILLIILILIIGGAFFNNVNAQEAKETVELKFSKERPFKGTTDEESNPKYTYTVKNNESTDVKYTVGKIYDIKDTESSPLKFVRNYTTLDTANIAYNETFYCLRGGVGFGASDSGAVSAISSDISAEAVQYNKVAEMHNDPKAVANAMNVYNDNIKWTKQDVASGELKVTFKIPTDEEIEGTKDYTINLYNAVLWVIDEAYLPTDKLNENNKIYDAEKYKAELLTKAGIPKTQQKDVTANDIEVIQQLAIWYFTNYDEQKNNTNPTVSQKTMYPAQFLTINLSNNLNIQRENNLNRLYQYLVYGAIQNADTYKIDPATRARTKEVEENKFDKAEPLTIKSVDLEASRPGFENLYSYYEIGPIKFSGNEDKTVDASSIVLYDAKGEVIPKRIELEFEEESESPFPQVEESGEKYTVAHIVYKFVDSEGNDVTTLKKGKDYKIRIYKIFEEGNTLDSDFPEDFKQYKYDMSKFSLEVTSTYSLTTATFYSNGNNNSQPVVEIEKEKKSEGDKIATGEFDLSLRKFITKIGQNEIKGDQSRAPKVSTDTLINGKKPSNGAEPNVGTGGAKTEHTATYTHPKNALAVKTNDKVVYTIRVYNEGDIDGIASEITDYLPTGLELVAKNESQINEKYGWEIKNGDSKIITTSYLKDAVIPAFIDGNHNVEVPDSMKYKKETIDGKNIYYADVEVECKVVAEPSTEDIDLRNIAAITECKDKSNNDINDRDSKPGDPGRDNYQPPKDNSTYKEDDDDYENLVLEAITKVTVKKEWQDDNDRDRKRPTQVEVQLYKKVNDNEDIQVIPEQKVTLNSSNGWTHTFDNLPKYERNNQDGVETKTEIKYAVKEIKIGEDNTEDSKYSPTITEDNSSGYFDFTIKNSYTPEKTKVSVTKQWSDDDSNGNARPESIEIQLYKTVSGKKEKVNDKVNLTSGNSWTHTFDNLPKYEDGVEIEYSVEEITVLTKYTSSITSNKTEDGYTITITNTYIQNKINIPVKKIWEDANDQDGIRPESITVVLYKNNTKTESELVLNEGNSWSGSFNNLDETDDQGEITYSVQEKTGSINGYIVKVEGSQITGFTITNTHNPEEVNIPVKKVWNDKDNQDGIRPAEIEVELYKTVEGITATTGQKKTLNEANGWTDTFANLPAKEEGKEIKYTIEEAGVPEQYTSEITGTEEDGYIITNTYIPKPFDLSLRKFITSINRNGKEVDFADRTPKIDTTTLIDGTFERNGEREYTATYEHSKEPLVVKKGDIITYTLRIYNEGERDGYATEITDYIPEGLALIKDYTTNYENEWLLPSDLDSSRTMKLVGEDGFYRTEEEVKNLTLDDFSNTKSLSDVELVTGEVKITTGALKDEEIKAFDKDKTEETEGWQKAEKGEGGLYYKDVEVSCLVIAENTYKGTITNIAEISEDKDENKQDVTDRDSTPNNKQDPYDTWQEDDDDYEPVVLKYFDLALRKFITGIETNGKTKEVTTRNPRPTMNEDGNIRYEHDKDPVYVANNDVVIYTIRVYNEGTMEGYAEEIADDIPEGLEYLPEHETNKKYGWKMYDEEGNETDKVEGAETVKTRYLSEAEGKAGGRDNLLKGFDSSKGISTEKPYNPDYRDVQIAFRVIEPSTSDRIITNSAQITEDSNDDEDSIPDEWNEGEDDQDREHIYVKYFDLSLLKWVTKTIVTVDGKTTTTETGFKPNTGLTETEGIRDNNANEPVAKVELDRKKLDRTTVKFVYKIRVTNEGEIEGYATEITDFIPKGLEFKEEDNKAYGWKKEGEDKVTTRALETKLLKPGESAEVEIVFTWKKDKNNLGLKTNIAEITEDYNENNSKDIDSTPDNKKDPYEKEQEDDDDFALVILSIKTGKGISYTILITIVTTMLAGGIYLIKKYVLRY